MGLLDDAIREHLELKRRRGADPTEVARAEQEALGPVRREPEPAPVQDAVQEEPHDALPHEPADEAAHGASEHAVAHDPAAHEQLEPLEPLEPADDLAPEDQTRILPPHQSAAPAHDEPPFADEHAEPAPPPHVEPAVHEQPPAETTTPPHGDPAHEEPAVDPRQSDVVHQPTTEWRIEDEDEPFADERPADEAASDEDVLEETPDFLQETPEHDRLWFEQRPPRDFDFDD